MRVRRELQPIKVRFSKPLIPLGIVLVLSLVQLAKACSFILVTVYGIFIYRKLMQIEKVKAAIVVSPSGSSTLLSAPQPAKADA